MKNVRRSVALLLRCLGLLDLCAIVAVVMPANWIQAAHAAVGLGTFPDAPIAAYLARSASALYALHGAMIVYISFDVDRYWRLIRFLAVAALIHGATMLAIDLSLDLPRWWQLIEGSSFAATGTTVLWLQREAKSSGECRNPSV